MICFFRRQRLCRALLPAAFAVLLSAGLSMATRALAETVTFELPRAPLTQLQKQRLDATARNLPQGVFTGDLRLPTGDGRHPAVVVIRTCHDADHYTPWLDRLASWGYATLAFSRCQPPDYLPDDADIPALDWKRGSLAAIGALTYLAERPDIDPDRIAVMSWSRLGMIPLSTLQLEGFAQFFEARFAAGIALYPFCSFARGPHLGPILIVAGAQDEWVDNTVCQRVAAQSRLDKHPVTAVFLENAVHGFDIAAFGPPRLVEAALINPDGFAAGGGRLGFNEPAAERAVEQVRRFLKQHLQ